MIRIATIDDISRIAEILVFSKRANYRSIFHDDPYSFGVIQVLPTAQELMDHPEILKHYYVFEDEFVKGIIHVEDREIKELYVDHFFEGQGIGHELISYVLEHHDIEYLWVLEKNIRAIAFYSRYGFVLTDTYRFEGDVERSVRMVRL